VRVLTRPTWLAPLLVLAGALGVSHAQTYTPQTPSRLSITFQTERLGGSRVLVFGEVRNHSGAYYDRVVLLAEGLDEAGRVVCRGRAYVSGGVPANGTSPFQVRILASGTERRFRVEVESFQQVDN
jgi:hypothetical protein